MLTQKILTITAAEASRVQQKLKTWTGSWDDDIYAVAVQVSGWVTFSNSVFKSEVNGEAVNPTL